MIAPLKPNKRPKQLSKYWVVCVKYGTRPNESYATVPSRASARILGECARRLGYRIVEVIPYDEWAKRRQAMTGRSLEYLAR